VHRGDITSARAVGDNAIWNASRLRNGDAHRANNLGGGRNRNRRRLKTRKRDPAGLRNRRERRGFARAVVARYDTRVSEASSKNRAAQPRTPRRQ